MNDDFNISIDPDARNDITRRILQVTDEDETVIPEFIEVEYVSPYLRRPTSATLRTRHRLGCLTA